MDQADPLREEPGSAAEAAARLARALRERILLARSFGHDVPLAFVPRHPRAAGLAGPPPAPGEPRLPPEAPRQSTLAVLPPETPRRLPERGPRGYRLAPRPVPPDAPGPEPRSGEPPPRAPSPRPSAPEEIAAERKRRQALLDPIRDEVRSCRSCVLCEKRTQAVFGVGDPCARLLFIGEGPGEDEDREGEPFVGKAGQLLTRMIQAMGLARKDVYIANIVKCRPPGNRTPEPREVISCFPYLKRQIQIIAPDVICALGNVAARTLLDTLVSITRLRGRFGEFQGIPVLPTFHPSYLLRNTGDKRLAWEDLRKLMAYLGLADPSTSREPPPETPESR